MFSKTSRYHDLPERTWRAPDGREVVYKARRLIRREDTPIESTTVVGQSERPDVVAARTLGRSELFWKLCDANGALDPWELTEPSGRVLWIPEI